MFNTLAEQMREEIAARGPVTFKRFMEQALYEPAHGYYASGKARIGRGGDFYTNVSVGPLFARLLCRQFIEIWERMGKPAPFVLMEQGANDGQFAADVLQELRGAAPDFLEALRYEIVEPFDAVKEAQREKLCEFGEKVSWSGSLSEVERFRGVHFSNELLDAMPVHLLVFRGGEWLEMLVGWRSDGFLFVEEAINDERLKRYAAGLGSDFPEGARLEANLEAAGWLERLAAKIESGCVMALDYGEANGVERAKQTGGGTLACYRQHRRTDDPLCAPGELDISARVDFSWIARLAVRAGFVVEGFTDQHRFMTGLAIQGLPKADTERERQKQTLAFNQLAHPDLMGTQFKVLCLKKNVEWSGRLLGFRFARHDLREGAESLI